MSPILPRRNDPDVHFSPVKTQWQNPTDILSILMIIGGDVVQRAIAQLAGSGPRPLSFAPVAFSFCWVAYALNALLSAVGDGRLLPSADGTPIIVNAKDGQSRPIRSWPLSRLVRNHEPPYEHEARGLCISFYATSAAKRVGVPDPDWVYWTSLTAIVIQLAISVIPGALHGNWMILIITTGGTLLALVAGALPQWQVEKWEGRRIEKGKREVVCLTEGNDSKAVIVVTSDGTGIRLADLANRGLEADAWYSLAVGALGMIQNVVAAGAKRSPSALRFHLDSLGYVYDMKVFDALKKAEEREPNVGISLISTFFPGGLLPDEEEWKNANEKGYVGRRKDAANIGSVTALTERQQDSTKTTLRRDDSAVKKLGGQVDSSSAMV
ncbi:hypothetical protein OBBRIDRAFT_824745 [Obba rivulosa]|uniref:Uncharacterized protein n=1 Tax=Obba rivulosa TaxID=1052685 RepID=A0A8E2B2A4_9APHY|nr:hypothetical protein OBBRIDRAFT_824745 [Obba rivulosa]